MNKDIVSYNSKQSKVEKRICEQLMETIGKNLKGAESKIWHGHPVWFIENNPIVGYSKLKGGLRLMFWSGADFAEAKLMVGSGKFKDASITYTSVDEVEEKELKRWLKKAKAIQWDYKNIVKRKGRLVRLV